MASSASDPIAQILWTPAQRLGSSSGNRRAGVACAFCRARKIKCNRLDDQPCTNCMFENVQCMLLPKQRRLRRARNAIHAPQLDLSGSRVLDDAIAATRSTVLPNVPQLDPPPSLDSPTQQPLEPEIISETSGPPDCDMRSSQDIDSEINWQEAAIEAVPTRPPNPSISPLGHAPSLGQSLASSLPSFLKPPPSCLGEQDLDYLTRKGALCIPEPELRDALVESYVHYIHPCYPILDLDALEEAILGNAAQSFSLSVYQAIMFAGSSWVDVKLLRKLGYLSRWAARKAFYLKARLLYDTDYEQDCICQLQTLILLSLWWKGPNEPKDGWHWLGLAISLARTLGLHQDATNKHLDTKTIALRRRLWWSCTIRDTFASFSCNRVPRISDADFVVAPLTLRDFEWNAERAANRRGIGKQSLDVRKQLAAICIQTAAICRTITKVLLTAYNETSTGNIDILYVNSTPGQGRSYIDPIKVTSIENEFRAWQIATPSNVSHSCPSSSPSSRHEQAPLVHRALLSILYHTGLIMMHRQRDPIMPAIEKPRDLVRHAAGQVNKIVMDMYAVDLMKDMPPTVISFLFPVSMSHILDMKSQNATLRREGAQRLEECKQALRELADGHLSAEWAVNFVRYVESKVSAQPRIMNVLSTTAQTRTLLRAEETSTCDQNDNSQRKDHDGFRKTAQYSTTLAGSDHGPTSRLLPQSSFEPNFGDSTITEDDLDWDNLDTMWFGLPEFQWDIHGVGQFAQNTMPLEFREGGFLGK